jgi:mannose-6-phosphate isomerase-like protein (cupin superfamily)
MCANSGGICSSVTWLWDSAIASGRSYTGNPEKTMSEAAAITHIDTITDAPPLADGVIATENLPAVGDAPGATAYVHLNGPTEHLSTLCAGMCILEPGASPHPPHRHLEEETMIVASGTGVIEVDGVATKVGPGAMMYCAANTLHGIVNTGSTPMTFYFSKWLGKGVSV